MPKSSQRILEYLSIWGDAMARTVPCLNYPDSTPEYRAIFEPGHGFRSNATPMYWPNPIACAVDKSVNKLEETEPELVNALWCRYVLQLNRVRAAEEMGKTLTQYDWMVEKATREVGRILGF